jgi:hypothetical protein
MIEEQLETLIVEVRHLRAALEGMVLQSPPGELPRPEVEEIDEVIAAPAPVEPVKPVVEAQPAAPIQTPAVGSASVTSLITKESLFQLILDTYKMLQTQGRGTEIGLILAEYDAMTVDELAPEHYPAVHQRLVDLRQGVANG